MDSHMAQVASLLLAQATHGPEHLVDLVPEMEQSLGVRKKRSKLALEFRVIGVDGQMLAQSANGPLLTATQPLGYADIEHQGERWRSLALATPNYDTKILVAQSIRQRDRCPPWRPSPPSWPWPRGSWTASP
jgi:hypothetical protein